MKQSTVDGVLMFYDRTLIGARYWLARTSNINANWVHRRSLRWSANDARQSGNCSRVNVSSSLIIWWHWNTSVAIHCQLYRSAV